MLYEVITCPRWPLEYLPALFSVTYEPIEGLEPTTPRLQITCSSQLSYIGILNPFRSQKKSAISNGLQMYIIYFLFKTFFVFFLSYK